MSDIGDAPAFPRAGVEDGMTYRQYLIAKAIQGLCAALNDYPRGALAYDADQVAEDAIEVADAVLKKVGA